MDDIGGADWAAQEQLLHELWEEVRERLTTNVEAVPLAGCWIWQGSLNEDGYGSIRVDGKKDKAHRASYRAFVGEIPPELHVCHICDVRCCINPAHLFLGTARDNMQDMVSKHGTRVTRRTLTDEQVMELRADTGSLSELSRKYGIHSTAISRIRNGHRWKHI